MKRIIEKDIDAYMTFNECNRTCLLKCSTELEPHYQKLIDAHCDVINSLNYLKQLLDKE